MNPAGQAVANTTIPSNNQYVLTTFGGGSDTQPLACGGTADGTWYYCADSQRWPCGTKLLISANGLAVVAQVADYGPAAWVETNAGMPIIDASPLVAQTLFSATSLGWSDRKIVTATPVDPSTPLGPATLQAGFDITAFLIVGSLVGAGYLLFRELGWVK